MPPLDPPLQLAVALDAYVVTVGILPQVYASTDPADIALFGDPDIPNQSVVYLPSSPHVYNTAALVYGPSGALLSSVHKHHLTPMEVSLLALTPGNVSENTVIPTPIGPLCVALCWDGFFEDVVSHLDGQGCGLLIQPSYNDAVWPAWLDSGLDNATHVWQPLDWTHGPLGMLQPTESVNINVVMNPMITGNLFDMVVDGQSAIVVRVRGNVPPLPPASSLYIGLVTEDVATPPYNVTAGGFSVLAIAPWAFPDNITAPVAARRASLAAQAQLLLPGSGSPLSGLYADSIILADARIL